MSLYNGIFGGGYFRSWNTYSYAYAQALASGASGIVTGDNPTYTLYDFYSRYPGFNGLIEPAIIQDFITIANGTVNIGRWFESWHMGMGLLIAHYATLFLQGQSTVDMPSAADIVRGGQSSGLVASKSVGDLSISYDNSLSNSIAADWGDFALTTYGKQFAMMAKRLAPAFFVSI